MSSFKLRKEKDCLNCGHEVEKHFCPQCGQENIEVKEDAVHMVAHAVADYFHFEHKFFGTIKPLLLKPGLLTSAYVAGKRVSFIHPIRLYIFISIVFFLVVLNDNVIREKPDRKSTTSSKSTERKLTSKEKDSLVKVQLRMLNKAMRYAPVSTKTKDSLAKELKDDIMNDRRAETNTNWNTGSSKLSGSWMPKDSTVALYEKNQAALPKAKRDGFLKHYFAKRSIELNKYPNPKQKFLQDFLHNIPKMMFLLLPLFALILKIVYINKKRYYYEHLIYSFHVHSAMFLSILVATLLAWLSGFVYDLSLWIILLCSIYIIWYIYRSLRTFYGSSRWVTLLRMFFLFVCYNIVLTICFILAIAVSFAMV